MKNVYRGETIFRPPRWQLYLFFIVSVGFPIGTYLEYASSGLTWVSMGLAALSIGAIAAVAETLTTKIVLSESELQIRKWFRKTSVERATIKKVTWNKGVGASIQRKDGSWQKIPEVGRNSQSLCNSVRAWLKAT